MKPTFALGVLIILSLLSPIGCGEKEILIPQVVTKIPAHLTESAESEELITSATVGNIEITFNFTRKTISAQNRNDQVVRVRVTLGDSEDGPVIFESLFLLNRRSDTENAVFERGQSITITVWTISILRKPLNKFQSSFVLG